MDEELKSAIKMLSDDIPTPDKDKKIALIKHSKHLVVSQAPHNRLNILSFCVQQLQFIRIRTWIFQFLIVIFAGLCIINAPSTRVLLALISAVGPLIYLVSASELIRSHVHRMQELELTTKYSYRIVMLARISVMNIINVFAITVLIFTVVKVSQIELFQAFFFVCIPFLLTSIAGLFILQRQHTKESFHWVYIAVGMLGISIMLIVYFYPQLFLSISYGLWWGIMLIAIGSVVYQYRQLLDSSSFQIEKNYA